MDQDIAPDVILAIGVAAANAVALELPFERVECFTGDDDQGYYTLVYRNGKLGPRSEGYADGLTGAIDAAERDFGLLLPVIERAEVGEGAHHGEH